MKPHILERRIGQDLALINASNQSICILDKIGEQVWNYYKKIENIEDLKKQIELPDAEKTSFYEFCNTLDNFLNKEITSSEQKLSLHQYFYNKKIPLVIALEINTNCQLKCKHCYNPQRDSSVKNNKTFLNLSLSSIKTLAEDLDRLRTPFVIITGGEPLLHPKFFDICRVLTSSGIALKIFTNGYDFNENIADMLSDLNVFLIGFTLFGSSSKDHEYISQVSGSFDRIKNAILIAKDHDIPVDVTFFLMKHNFKARNEMKKWASDELDIEPSFSFTITPRETGDLKPFELEINSHQMEVFFEEEGIVRESLQCGDETMVPCTAGKNLVAIKADGNVTPCVSLVYPLGNINKQRFIDIWLNEKKLKEFRSLKIEDIEQCRDCNLANICLRCFVNAQFLGKNIFGKDPHACKVTNSFKSVREKVLRKEIYNEAIKSTEN